MNATSGTYSRQQGTPSMPSPEPMQTSHLAPRVQAENECLREALKFVRTLARHDPAIRKVVDEALGTEDE